MRFTRFDKVYKNIILENEEDDNIQYDNSYQFKLALSKFFDFSFLKKEYPKWWQSCEHATTSTIKELAYFFKSYMYDKFKKAKMARSQVKSFYQFVKKLGWVKNTTEFKNLYMNNQQQFSIKIIKGGYRTLINIHTKQKSYSEMLEEAKKFVEWYDNRNKPNDLSDFDNNDNNNDNIKIEYL